MKIRSPLVKVKKYVSNPKIKSYPIVTPINIPIFSDNIILDEGNLSPIIFKTHIIGKAEITIIKILFKIFIIYALTRNSDIYFVRKNRVTQKFTKLNANPIPYIVHALPPKRSTIYPISNDKIWLDPKTKDTILRFPLA